MRDLERTAGSAAGDLLGQISAFVEQARAVVATQTNVAWILRYWVIGLIFGTGTSREQIELLKVHKDGTVTAECWPVLTPKEELERRITQIYDAAQERVARHELGVGGDDKDEA